MFRDLARAEVMPNDQLSSLRPMTSFNPSEPAILHDRRSDSVETWTGEEAADYNKHSVVKPDGSVEWRQFIFDGWGSVLGG
jgi:hypothetical protein